ncbi:hypothetical protein IW261DRAFT_1517666 [Armillaria novae-zelandiae]|uniref:C2H2-type domain-containing protein n=1 Tax=Armillaria novae-zelandiae TaxID=153914 RepID=A0AA39U7M0_9AGAR|nr:hypothetical protein IW261DRAFT_1517666 [Armillaria novae-zelandiae]
MPRVPSENSKDRFYCLWPGCGKDYASQSSLSRHKRVHNPFAIMYECPFCKREMSQKANLDSHIENTHLAPYKCPVVGCWRAFKKPLCFERHVSRCNGPQDLNASVSSSPAPPPNQLLPAANAGQPLEGLGVFPASPESDLDSWSPQELMSVPDSSTNSRIATELPASPTFYEHQVDHQRNVSNAETLKEMEEWLKICFNASNPGLDSAASFDASFSVPSSSTSSDYSVSPASSSLVEGGHISRTSEQMLASYIPRDDTLSIYRPPTQGTVNMSVNTSSPSPIDNWSTGDFSFLSFETTGSPFSIDSVLSLPSSSSFEEPVFDFNFEQSVGITDSFSFF